MNLHNAASTRVATRPLWTMLLVQFLVGPAYRIYWMWRANEDLRSFGRVRPDLVDASAAIRANGAASAAWVTLALPGWLLLWLGALPWGSSFAPDEYGGLELSSSDRAWCISIGIALLLPGIVSILRTHRRIRRARVLAGLPRDTRWTGGLFSASLPLELVVLPVWQFLLQHSLNDLWSHFPELLDEDLHGELAPPRLRETAQQRRPDLHQRRLERIADELEQPRRVPWTAIAFAATCGAVFIFQLVQHGPFPDERDLEAVGGLRSDLDAMPWRYFMANLLHGGVDHLSGNLLMWGFIGTIVERVVGWLRMLVLVVVGAAACSAGALVAEPDIVGVGASGVVFAAIGLAVALDPFARRTVGRFGWILLLLGIGLSTFAPGISAGGHVGGLLGGFAVGALIAVAWRIPHVSVPKGVPLYATQLVDRSAPLAPHRALTIEERLTHLDRQRQAGTLAPFEYERLRNVLLLRG